MADGNAPTWKDYIWLLIMPLLAWWAYPEVKLMILPLVVFGMWLSIIMAWHFGWRKTS